jgi:formyl-CoA transferase
MVAIRPAMLALPKVDLLTRLLGVGVPCGPINTIEEALTSEQAQARGAVVDIPRADVGKGHVRLLGNPLKFSATPVTSNRPPPRFGQDTAEVLETWGPDSAENHD